jgi:ubiquitin
MEKHKVNRQHVGDKEYPLPATARSMRYKGRVWHTKGDSLHQTGVKFSSKNKAKRATHGGHKRSELKPIDQILKRRQKVNEYKQQHKAGRNPKRQALTGKKGKSINKKGKKGMRQTGKRPQRR